jgi:hypothetical protein
VEDVQVGVAPPALLDGVDEAFERLALLRLVVCPEVLVAFGGRPASEVLDATVGGQVGIAL